MNYRDYRGEQRMSVKKAVEVRARGEPAGDCVDCGQCVTVCPIGIDIRQGPNFACINCGLCVDACDTVMAKIDRPRGLIDYESWTNIELGRKSETGKRRLLRPKTVGLAAFCVVLAAGMSVLFVTRSSGSMSVQHDRNPRFVPLSDGSIRNAYDVKILNRSALPHAFGLRAEGLESARIEIMGVATSDKIEVPGDASRTVRVTLTSPIAHGGAVRFVADDGAGHIFVATDNFVVH